MDFEKTMNMVNLFSLYGKLLNKNQIEVCNAYYKKDLSLTEIAEELKISRQAVLDTIKKENKQL